MEIKSFLQLVLGMCSTSGTVSELTVASLTSDLEEIKRIVSDCPASGEREKALNALYESLATKLQHAGILNYGDEFKPLLVECIRVAFTALIEGAAQ